MDRLAQVAPPEAYTNRWGTSPLGSISRVAINQVLGGRSLKSAIGALDSAKERIGTKNLTTQGLAEPGTHLHTLSQMAIQDAMMGRGVYDPAVNASNFTAGPRPTNISKTAKSAWNTTPLGTYKGTTYRSDPAYGDKIASANQLASSIINGTAVSSPSVPDVQVASVDPRGSLSVANRAAMGRPAGLGMDPRGSISVADRAAAGKPAAPGSLDARIAAAQAAMPNVHASSIPSPMEQVANPTSAPPPSSPMLVGQIEGNRIVGRYGPVGKIQDRIASAPGLGPGLMAAPDVNLGASKGLSAAVSPEKPQNFADSFLGQGLSTIGNGIVDGVNAFNDGMRQFNQHKGKLSFANAIGINPIGDAVKDAASGGIRSLQNSIASMMNGVSSSPNVQVASTPSPQQETNTMPNRNPLVGGVRAPAVNNHPASGTLASIMGGANAGDAAATVAALSSGKLEHQQRLAARAARPPKPGHSTPIPPVTTPPGTTPVPGTPPAPFAFDFSPIQAMFAKLAAGIDPATGKSIYNSKGKSKA